MKQKSNKTRNPHISGTLTHWALSLGLDREKVSRDLAKCGYKLEIGAQITAREIFNAITGDKESAMTRKLLAEAEEKERENRIAEGEILTVEDAEKKLGNIVTALVQSLDALPALVPGLSLEQRQILVLKIEEIKEKARKA